MVLYSPYAGMHRAADLVLAYYLLDSVAANRDSALLWLDPQRQLACSPIPWANLYLSKGQESLLSCRPGQPACMALPEQG